MSSASKHVHSPEENRLLEIRLRKIIGQLQAVEKMVSGHRDCIEILTQIVSARRALKSFAEIIIRSHAHDCIGNFHAILFGEHLSATGHGCTQVRILSFGRIFQPIATHHRALENMVERASELPL